MSRDQPFVRNWRDQQPANSHGAIGWKILTERGEGKPYALSPLIGLHGLTFRMLQAGMVEPAHTHEAKEHVYYIIRGRGKVQRAPIKPPTSPRPGTVSGQSAGIR